MGKILTFILCLLLASAIAENGHKRGVRSPQGPGQRGPPPGDRHHHDPGHRRPPDFDMMIDRKRPPVPGGPENDRNREEFKTPPQDYFEDGPMRQQGPLERSSNRPYPPPDRPDSSLRHNDTPMLDIPPEGNSELPLSQTNQPTKGSYENDDKDNLNDCFSKDTTEAKNAADKQKTFSDIKADNKNILLQKNVQNPIIFQVLAVTPESEK